MNEDLNFEAYLLISQKKLIISVLTDLNEKIFEKELKIDHNEKKLIFDKLDIFLDENIFELEKKLKYFVKKIIIIIDLDEFLPIEISIKRSNYENIINLSGLNHMLNEVKDYCKESIGERRIVHMLISNYKIDNKDFSSLPLDIYCKSFSLDINFICISESLIKMIEIILKKYQISLSNILSAKYINEFLKNEKIDFFIMTKKIVEGHNPNEVLMVNKINKNKGFFEKFFNFFN